MPVRSLADPILVVALLALSRPSRALPYWSACGPYSWRKFFWFNTGYFVKEDGLWSCYKRWTDFSPRM